MVKQNELFADEVQRMSQLHLKYVLFQISRERATKYAFKDERLRDVINLLIRIYAVKELKADN